MGGGGKGGGGAAPLTGAINHIKTDFFLPTDTPYSFLCGSNEPVNSA